MVGNKRVIVVGGGIIGLATALTLLQKHNILGTVLEAEDEVATHQTGRNSGVIHSGLYYRPDSLKAQNCTEGREKIIAFCETNEIAYARCGKLVVATREEEFSRLLALHARGVKNGLAVQLLDESELAHYEPHVRGIAGLWVPETGIVNYRDVARKMVGLLELGGWEIIRNARVEEIDERDEGVCVKYSGGESSGAALINCAGLQADRVAKMCGIELNIRIVPFRGEYYDLIPEKAHLVKNLIYPVPDPQFPFLGVHFTRMINGGVEAGPNAVMAFKREGYKYTDISLRDIWDSISFQGLWRLGMKHWQVAIQEYYQSTVKTEYVKSLQRLIPEIDADDLVRGRSGVRAQALTAEGKLVDDFYIKGGCRSVHVLNAPSPAATASLSIGESIAERLIQLDLI